MQNSVMTIYTTCSTKKSKMIELSYVESALENKKGAVFVNWFVCRNIKQELWQRGN